MATPRKTYSPSLKAEIVRAIWRETRAINQIAAQHGIQPKPLYAWRDQAATALPDLFTDHAAQTLAAQQASHAAECDQLYAEIGRLTTALNWLQKKWRRSRDPSG